VLYIAEVTRQSKAFITGKNQITLKLLACQRSDQSWSAVSGDDALTFDDPNASFGGGALLLVNLSNNRQIQGRPELAGAKIASLLQNLSRQVEKSRGQEEEIEQWKQSLTFQAQELNRREMELEAGRDQLEHQEQELTRLEQECAELERRRDELGGAATGGNGGALDEAQAAQLRSVVDRLAAASGSVTGPLQDAIATVERQQQSLAQRQERLAQQRATAEQKSTEVGQCQARASALQQELADARASLDEARAQARSRDRVLEAKQDKLKLLSRHLEVHGDLRDAIAYVATTSDLVKLTQVVDLDALRQLPMAELETRVATLQQDLEKVLPFVNDQEEELGVQRTCIEELQAQLEAAGENERPSLALELEEERDRYRFLEETLVGQRRTLKVRQNILEQHRQILGERQGTPLSAEDGERIDLGPVLQQIEEHRTHLEEELQRVDGELREFRASSQQLTDRVQEYERLCAAKREELQRTDTALQQARATASDLWGQVNASESLLQQQQSALQSVRQSLDDLAAQSNLDDQQAAIAQAQAVIGNLAAARTAN